MTAQHTAKGEHHVDAIERLVAIEDIKRTKAKYFRCMDTKDW